VSKVTDSSSFMISHLIDGLQEVVPDSERSKLEEFTKLASNAGSDPASEWQRAFRCARWAEEMVSLPAHRHLTGEAERSMEAVRLVEGTAATTLGQFVPSPWHVSNEFAVLLWMRFLDSTNENPMPNSSLNIKRLHPLCLPEVSLLMIMGKKSWMQVCWRSSFFGNLRRQY